MPVIPEEKEMEEFVNWDHADPAVGAGAFNAIGTGVDFMSRTMTIGEPDQDHDLDLVLENVEGDDFSFWALQHYENSNPVTVGPAAELPLPTAPMATNNGDSPHAFEESFETPDAPCDHCSKGGYQCKKIREGKYKGYCTSCVALRCECSFGLASTTEHPTASGFPYNPWPWMGDHPEAIPQEDMMTQDILSHALSAPDLAGLVSHVAPEGDSTHRAPSNPKIGARFSRESVRILKNWLSTHNRHPYPSEEEKEMLQKQTGLNKTQISNWLANARRRGKIVAPRSTSPGVRSFSNAIDIPQRRGTPAAFEQMNPLQRWQNSPPESEPASVTAIARAVTASSSALSSGLNSPYSLNFTDDGSGKSLCAASSASSLGTSASTGSFPSVLSQGSRGSFGSFSSMSINHRGRRRRRKKTMSKRPEEKTPLTAPLKTFQCTFCTETFRTKHDWQRHEKSLHLSLERWVCTPDGPKVVNQENGQFSCVFCGLENPDEAHCESHNHSACQERTLAERTFYRKDHLRQHLKLVHGAKFLNWTMEGWKVASPEIFSRCGFCGIVMDSWTIRIDHLAEHFKTGYSMADWKGDWGFDAPVLDMVENSIPPYLIHDERNTPYPYEATQGSPETPRNAYELIKSELAFYIYSQAQYLGPNDTAKVSDEELQFEAARIIFGAEVLSKGVMSSTPSWLRDLVLSNQEIAMKARLAPIKSAVDSRQALLKINGKDNIFEEDTLEAELLEYVKARQMLGLTAMDSELQVEACKIIGRMEESSNNPSDIVANFLLRLIYGSPRWLANFRQRAVLPRSEEIGDEARRSTDLTKIDSTIHNYSRLEVELAQFVEIQRSLGTEPTDADLQKQARIIIYEFDDGWNQTAADNVEWLSAFKLRHVSSEASAATLENNAPLTIASLSKSAQESLNDMSQSQKLGSGLLSGLYTNGGGSCNGGQAVKLGTFFLNDANCYRRLAKELTRFVASTTSPNNPNRHVPNDEELQHQARWILYDSDDPWNQTAADNAEWLRRFKRDVGILTDPSLPGLPDGSQWSLTQGGTGFAPPYVAPHPGASFDVSPETAAANRFIQGLSTRMEPPAAVFCSRELEKGLVDYVVKQVDTLGKAAFPSDEALRQKAKKILQLADTAADDPVLLDKFKAMMQEKLAGTEAAQPVPVSPPTLAVDVSENSAMPVGMDVSITDNELNDILQDLDFDFGDTVDGGVSLGGVDSDAMLL